MIEKPGLTQQEKDKLEIDPDFDFREIAKRPFTDLSTNEIGMFKWSGVYHQLQTGFFMIRLRLPGGVMTAEQLRVSSKIAKKYGQDQLCITTRQTLQYHWLRKEDLHKVIEEAEAAGMSTRNACGDVTRNVVGCSLQGVCPHELGDSRGKLLEIANDDELLNVKRNLPRKHKISVSGCGRACGYTLMNCQGWYPVERKDEAGLTEMGWKYHAGGGLGARPFMAKAIFDWVPANLVLPVTQAAATVFEQQGNRRKRAYSRMKFVVDKLGAKGFGEAVLDELRKRNTVGLDAIEFSESADANVGDMFLDGQEVIPQRQNGFNTVRVMIKRSEMTAAEAEQIAAWSDEYGNGEIMFTQRQNLEMRFVPDDKVQILLNALHAAGYRTEGHDRVPDLVACVGTTQCNLAVADTPATYRALYEALSDDKTFWEDIGPLRINMNGCPNSCAHHWIADIGLRGTRTRGENGSEEGFTLHVGGSLSGAGRIGEPVCDLANHDVVPAIRKLLDLYLEERSGTEETFVVYVQRVGVPRLRSALDDLPVRSEMIYHRNASLKQVFSQAVEDVSK